MHEHAWTPAAACIAYESSLSTTWHLLARVTFGSDTRYEVH